MNNLDKLEIFLFNNINYIALSFCLLISITCLIFVLQSYKKIVELEKELGDL